MEFFLFSCIADPVSVPPIPIVLTGIIFILLFAYSGFLFILSGDFIKEKMIYDYA